MGASLVYLNEPNTDIEHEVGQNDYLKFAAGSMQGWRLNMVSATVKFPVLALRFLLSHSTAEQPNQLLQASMYNTRDNP